MYNTMIYIVSNKKHALDFKGRIGKQFFTTPPPPILNKNQ